MTKLAVQQKQLGQENEDLRKKVVDLQARLVTLETKLSDQLIDEAEREDHIDQLEQKLNQREFEF